MLINEYCIIMKRKMYVIVANKRMCVTMEKDEVESIM